MWLKKNYRKDYFEWMLMVEIDLIQEVKKKTNDGNTHFQK